MVNDKTAVGLGVPFLILIGITWLTSFSLVGLRLIYTTLGGLFILFGLLLLIPVFILTIIFLSTQNSSCESVAFGFGFIGWFLVIIGAVMSLYETVSDYLLPALFILFICPQIILGFGLFARRTYNQIIVHPPTQQPYGMQPNRPHVQPRNAPRGRMVIPEEVRVAGTYGQSIKRCVKCGNTLDIKTMVCYFCGARQPNEPANAPPQRPLPPEPARPTHPTPPRGTPAAADYAFCPSCGAKVFRGHLFCTQCGSSLEL